MAQGNGMLSLGFLEEGQLLSDMGAKASKNGTEYQLQGKKDFIPLAGLADHLIVACRTGPKDAGKISLFLLNRASDPVDIRPSGTQLGMRMISMEEWVLDNVSVPADRLIGEENEGHGPLMGFLQEMAVEAGAMGVGMAQGAFDRALDYSGKREQFGKKNNPLRCHSEPARGDADAGGDGKACGLQSRLASGPGEGGCRDPLDGKDPGRRCRLKGFLRCGFRFTGARGI